MPESKSTNFLLRLPKSTKEQAVSLAVKEEISLNHFISIAVAERLERMWVDTAKDKDPPVKEQRYFRN